MIKSGKLQQRPRRPCQMPIHPCQLNRLPLKMIFPKLKRILHHCHLSHPLIRLYHQMHGHSNRRKKQGLRLVQPTRRTVFHINNFTAMAIQEYHLGHHCPPQTSTSMLLVLNRSILCTTIHARRTCMGKGRERAHLSITNSHSTCHFSGEVVHTYKAHQHTRMLDPCEQRLPHLLKRLMPNSCFCPLEENIGKNPW